MSQLAVRIEAALAPRGMLSRAAEALGTEPSVVSAWYRVRRGRTRPAVPEWHYFEALLDFLQLEGPERDAWTRDWEAANKAARGGPPIPFGGGRWVYVPIAA